MKKKFMKTIAAALMVSVLFAMAAYAAEWERTDNNHGWIYRLDDGSAAVNTWITDPEDGSAYYVGSNGLMLTDSWIQVGDKWYYLGSDGNLMRGTILELNNNKTLYLLGDDGAMMTNVWYWDPTPTEEDPNKGDWYYFGPDGIAYKSGWYNIDGDEYYFLNSCKMAHDALVSGGRVGSDGKRIK